MFAERAALLATQQPAERTTLVYSVRFSIVSTLNGADCRTFCTANVHSNSTTFTRADQRAFGATFRSTLSATVEYSFFAAFCSADRPANLQALVSSVQSTVFAAYDTAKCYAKQPAFRAA